MKICGMMMIGMVGVCLGLFPAMKLQKRAKRLQLYETFIGSVSEHIRYTASPISEIFSSLSHETEWQALNRYLANSSDWQEGFSSFLQEDKGQNGLQEEECELLIRWCNGLGRTDLAGQMSHCNRYREEIKTLLSDAKQEARIKGKLYTTLGVTGGLTVVLMWL